MNTKDQNEINIGIDTGQAMLDIFVRPQGDFQSFENNPEGIRSAIRFIKSIQTYPGVDRGHRSTRNGLLLCGP